MSKNNYPRNTHKTHGNLHSMKKMDLFIHEKPKDTLGAHSDHGKWNLWYNLRYMNPIHAAIVNNPNHSFPSANIKW